MRQPLPGDEAGRVPIFFSVQSRDQRQAASEPSAKLEAEVDHVPRPLQNLLARTFHQNARFESGQKRPWPRADLAARAIAEHLSILLWLQVFCSRRPAPFGLWLWLGQFSCPWVAADVPTAAGAAGAPARRVDPPVDAPVALRLASTFTVLLASHPLAFRFLGWPKWERACVGRSTPATSALVGGVCAASVPRPGPQSLRAAEGSARYQPWRRPGPSCGQFAGYQVSGRNAVVDADPGSGQCYGPFVAAGAGD